MSVEDIVESSRPRHVWVEQIRPRTTMLQVGPADVWKGQRGSEVIAVGYKGDYSEGKCGARSSRGESGKVALLKIFCPQKSG